jgi:hypothetical protein
MPDKEGKIIGHVVLSPEDLENAVNSSGRLKLLVALVVMGALLAFGAAVGTRRMDFGLTVVFPGVFAALLVLYFRRIQKKATARLLANQPEAERDTTFELDESGYLRTTGLSSSRAAWSTLTSQQETKYSFVLFSTHAGHVILPKRAFHDEDIEPIRALLRTQVKGAAPRPNQARVVVIMWVLLVVTFVGVWFGLGGSEPAERHHQHGAQRHDPTTEHPP